jgi:putative PIN family toxin of toxin-antitoxin system
MKLKRLGKTGMPKSRQRIVIDTNIFISFLINSDFSKLDKIIIEGKASLLLSAELVDELITVFDRPKFKKLITNKDKETLMSFFTEFGELVKIKSKVKLSRDHKDDFLLSLSIDGKATHLITGDADLLVLKKVKKTQILTVKEYFNQK